jgi:hypothetical protein
METGEKSEQDEKKNGTVLCRVCESFGSPNHRVANIIQHLQRHNIPNVRKETVIILNKPYTEFEDPAAIIPVSRWKEEEDRERITRRRLVRQRTCGWDKPTSSDPHMLHMPEECNQPAPAYVPAYPS